MHAAYLRQPTVCGDAVVFVADDDLWRVDVGGGTAQRLTAGLGEPGTPCLSPDGRWIAYTGRDEQHPEVWLMPAEGGPAQRLTWLAADTSVRGWTPDGQILFSSNHGQPFLRNVHAFSVPVEGGLPQPLGLGQVNHLAFGPDGQRVIGRNTLDPARWKRYRGGTAGHLWVDAAGSGEFPPHERTVRQPDLADVAGRPGLVSRRWRGRGQSLLGELRWQRPAASYRPRRALRAPRADRWPAHRLPVRRAALAVRPGAGRGPPHRRARARRRARSAPAASCRRPSICRA
jgi:hypothetical protein